ncbi:MAG: hypothetical protein K2R98_22885 [Gemmataceae bacterium]|nr:hypothetical protein [Gemmataceae bacterium]
MSQIQQVVDELRSLLQSADQQLTDHLKNNLAPAYHAACQEANQRLRRCDEYLSKGLRSEAIHLAQADPVLLDLVATLDFPERSGYEQLCLMYGLPAPPQLQMDTATALNEAYADDQPIEELLRKHRLLALGRAPLGARLALLRRIAQLDAKNALWEEDVRTFERARFQQMFDNVDMLIQRNNLAALTAASNELSGSKWLVAPPVALANKIDGAVRRMGQAKSLSGLQALEAKLYEAMNAFDLNQAVALRKQWNGILGGASLAQTDPLAQRANVVFQWIDEQFRRKLDETNYQAAVANLQAAIDAGQPRDALEGLAHKVLNFNRGMPELLEQRYQSRLQDLSGNARRRRRLLIVVPAACLLLAGAVTGWVLYRQSELEKTSSAVSKLNRMLEANELGEAKAYLQHLAETDPKLIKQGEILEVQAKIQSREKEEEGRKVLFEQALKDAEAAGLDSQGDDQLARAKSLAKLPQEISAVGRVTSARKDRREKNQLARDNEFLPQLLEVRGKVDQLEKLLGSGADFNKATDLLGQQEAAMVRLRSDSRGVSERIIKDIDSIGSRLELIRKTLESKNLEGTLLASLNQSLSGPQDFSSYVKAAERYIKEFPDREMSKGLRAAIGERDHWQTVLEWEKIAKGLGARPLTVTVKDAKSQAEACRKFLAKHPAFPDAAVLDTYLKCLDAVAQRDEGDAKGAAAEFRAIFGDQLVKDLWYVKLDDGKVYYSRENLDKLMRTSTDGYLRFKYVVGYDLKDRQALKKTESVTRRGPAPQSALAESAQALAENFGEKAWEDTLIGFAQKIRGNTEMDPILRVILLRRLLSCAVKASHPLEGPLAAFRERIDNRGFEIDVAWADPENKEAAQVRQKAREFMDKFPTLAPVLKASAESRQKLESSIAQTFRTPIGWLAQGKDSRWECRLPSGTDLTPFAEAYVLVPATEGPAIWHRIGKVDRGKLLMDTLKEGVFTEGRVVFANRVAK